MKSSVEEFANETPIQGIKELFIQDAKTSLKVFWSLFLIVCMAVMMKQIILACTVYADEKTVTLVRVQDVSDNFTGSLNICFEVAVMDLVSQIMHFGENVGRLLAGGSVFYRDPSMWAARYITNDTALLDLTQLPGAMLRKNTTRQTKPPFNNDMKQMLESMGVNKLFAEDHDYTPTGMDDNSLCFVSRYHKAVTIYETDSDIDININSNSMQNIAVSFYSFRDNVFQSEKGVNLYLLSSKMRRTMKHHRYTWGLDDEVTATEEQPQSQIAPANYHTE